LDHGPQHQAAGNNATNPVSDLVSQTGSTALRLSARRNSPAFRLKNLFRSALNSLGYQIHANRLPSEEKFNIPDRDLYRPLFSPWFAHGSEFEKYFAIASPRSLVAADACYVLWSLLRQSLALPGDVWECGVFQGGTAAMAAAVLRNTGSQKKLYLFDTFEGMPEVDASHDTHHQGDFSEVSIDAVLDYIGSEDQRVIRKGLIPETFTGLESSQIAFAHIDVVLYQATLDSIRFIWPRLTVGGFIVFDDYGFGSCPGARAAVDEFFANEICIPLCLPTGQAVAFKSYPS
jgi:O-methyltransferase